MVAYADKELGHSFTVISTDFTPIVPYNTDILNINIGKN